MIRQPTKDPYVWWRQAIADPATPRHDADPQCGWFKRRLVKGGPWVPVRIYLESDIDADTGELASDERMRIEVEGLDAGDPADQWTFLRPVSREEYDHLIDYRLRDSRMMDARQKIDLSETPTPPQGVF